MNKWDEFFGPNAGYALELYERYQQDPASLDASSRAFFDRNPPPPEVLARTPEARFGSGPDPAKVAAAFNLAQAIRCCMPYILMNDSASEPFQPADWA